MSAVMMVQVAVLIVTGIAAYTDARTGLIPNWLTFPPLIIAPIAYGFMHGISGVVGSLASMLACGLVPYLLFRKDAIGGGDVKLFAAIGALFGGLHGGLGLGFEAQLFAFITAGVFALGKLAWEGKLLRTFMNSIYIVINPVLPVRYKREVVPELMTMMRLGVSIFVGVTISAALRFAPMWM